MDGDSNIRAVKRFMSACHAIDGTEIKVSVEVFKSARKIHTGFAELYCCYNVGYMQYDVSINWSFDDSIMREIGLRGIYNTNFHEFSFSDGVLTIKHNSVIITIAKD